MAEKADAFLEKNVMKVLANAGEMVKEGAKAPGMPKFMTNYIDSAHEFLWDDAPQRVNIDALQNAGASVGWGGGKDDRLSGTRRPPAPPRAWSTSFAPAQVDRKAPCADYLAFFSRWRENSARTSCSSTASRITSTSKRR